MLTKTAKDWWVAEKQHLSNWLTFKASLCRAFLAKDHDIEVGTLVERDFSAAKEYQQKQSPHPIKHPKT